MLILADLSGIQDYLFEVREVGGKQARTLRFRSLYIQLITEAVGARLLRAAGLAGDRLVFCAAGKLAIDGAGLTDPPNAALDQEARQVECWLRNRTQGRLRLSIAICDSSGAMAAGFRAANRSLQAAKLRSWSNSACGSGGWQPDLMLAGVPEDPEAEADRDARLGRELTSPASRYLVFGEDSSSASFDVAGLFASMTPTAKAGRQRGIPGLRPHPEVNSRLSNMAGFLRLSAPTVEQRECRPRASWRTGRIRTLGTRWAQNRLGGTAVSSVDP
jgi:hypothetical protein